MDTPLTRLTYRGCVPPASGLHSGQPGLHSALSGLRSPRGARGRVIRGVQRSKMPSTFFLLFNYHHDAVDNLTFRNHSMSSDRTSLSVVFGRNTTAKALDQPALDGTNPIRSVADALLFDLSDF